MYKFYLEYPNFIIDLPGKQQTFLENPEFIERCIRYSIEKDNIDRLTHFINYLDQKNEIKIQVEWDLINFSSFTFPMEIVDCVLYTIKNYQIFIQIFPFIKEEDYPLIINTYCKEGAIHHIKFLHKQLPESPSTIPFFEKALSKSIKYSQLDIVRFLHFHRPSVPCPTYIIDICVKHQHLKYNQVVEFLLMNRTDCKVSIKTINRVATSGNLELLMGLWVVLLGFTVFSYQPTIHSNLPQIISRKYFHILAILMFTPPILFNQKGFMTLSFSVAISALVLLELVKYARAPPLAHYIRLYMDRFIDHRDSGIIVLTHIYLLLGCSIPVFFSYISDQIVHPQQQHTTIHFLSAFSGLLTIGVGDTMASYVGVKIGRTKWFGTSKSLEGTIAGALSSFLIAILLFQYHSTQLIWSEILKILFSCLLSSIFEASTYQIDNLVLPLLFFTTINLL
eukprot:gene419-531_t